MLGRRGTGRGAGNASLYHGVRPLPDREKLLLPLGSQTSRRNAGAARRQQLSKVVVVAHRSRSRMAHALARKVDADRVLTDDGTLGCEGNHRRSWQWLADNAGGCGWCVVLEDDALPVSRFREELDAALAVAPSPVVGLYLGRGKPRLAQDRIANAIVRVGDASWITAPRLWHGVGTAVLADLVPDLVQYLERRDDRPIDEAITAWAMDRNRPVAYTWPSLVDHADVEPVIRQRADRQPRDRPRRAWRVGHREEWTSAAVAVT